MALPSRALNEIEKSNPDGLSSRQILEIFERHGERLSEATLRKYVQLGLLPRSRRVGQKGKHRGSRGIYPVDVVRRVDEIRRAMENGETLETLSRAAQAVRAKLSLVRVAVDESMEAAERDISARDLDRKSRSALKAELNALRKDSKEWVRALERWTGSVEEAETERRKAAMANGKKRRSPR
ncbi:MAG: MerR family transcriptional regulator [Myxococcota bacterium]